MPQPDAEVRSLLEGRLATMPGLPALVEYENRALAAAPDPDADTWLRSRVLFGAQVVHSVNGQGAQGIYDNGAYVVTIFVPQDAGPGALDTLAAAVRSHFKAQRLVGTNVSVALGNSSRGPGLEPPQGEPPFYYAAVTVQYRAYYSLG